MFLVFALFILSKLVPKYTIGTTFSHQNNQYYKINGSLVRFVQEDILCHEFASLALTSMAGTFCGKDASFDNNNCSSLVVL